MLVKTLKRAGFGFILGMAVGNLIAALTGDSQIVSSVLLERAGSLSAALLFQTLLSGLIGAAGFGGMSLYEIEDWPLLRAAAVHYLLYMIVLFFSGLYLGWFGTAVGFLAMAGIMGAAHLCIFFVMCAYYRARVKELNEMNAKITQNS